MLLFEPSKPTNRAKATNCGIIISAERLHLLRFVRVDKSNRIFAIQDYSKTYVYVFGKWIQNKGVFFSIQPSITVFLTLTVGFSPLSSGPRTAYPWTTYYWRIVRSPKSPTSWYRENQWKKLPHHFSRSSGHVLCSIAVCRLPREKEYAVKSRKN